MGQAKQRGTREQRITQSVQRTELATIETQHQRALNAKAEQAAVDALPPEQQQRKWQRDRARRRKSSLLGLTLAAVMASTAGSLG